MKKSILSVVFLCLSFICYSQQYPTGLPIVDDINTHPAYRDIPRASFKLKFNKGEELPTFWDNSKNKYFPPIVYQIGGSCAFASCIRYIYNYEYNLINDIESYGAENIYNYLQIYALLNNGRDAGGHGQEGWELIRENGVLSTKDAKDINIYIWNSGYEMYKNGMEKGVEDISMFISDKEGEIERMKQYLVDHGEGMEYGGLIQFSAFAHDLGSEPYTGTSETDIKNIVYEFGRYDSPYTPGMHSMTIVGYDDTVWWDYNNNGNKDSDEVGAFICVNSWGSGWGDRGKFYAPYRTFTIMEQGYGGTGNGGKACMILKAKKNDVKTVVRVKMKHSSRNDYKLELGVSDEINALNPKIRAERNFMNFAGGDLPMSGSSRGGETLDFGLNYTELSEQIDGDEATYFLTIDNRGRGTKNGEGEIIFCSLYDYSDDIENPIEYIGEIQKKELKEGTVNKVVFNVAHPKLTEKISIGINPVYDKESKRLLLYLNSREKTDLNIDLINSDGTHNRKLLVKEVLSGLSFEKIYLSSTPVGVYYIRINADETMIYKKIKIE